MPSIGTGVCLLLQRNPAGDNLSTFIRLLADPTDIEFGWEMGEHASTAAIVAIWLKQPVEATAGCLGLGFKSHSEFIPNGHGCLGD